MELKNHELAKVSGRYCPGSPRFNAHVNLSYQQDPDLILGQGKPESSSREWIKRRIKEWYRVEKTPICSAGPFPDTQPVVTISGPHCAFLSTSASNTQYPQGWRELISLQAPSLARGLYSLNSQCHLLFHMGGWRLTSISSLYKPLKENFPQTVY